MKRLLFIVILAVLAVGCTRTIYVPVQSAHVEYRDRIRADSVFLRDSVYVREKGDTFYMYRDRYVYRDKLRVDSVFVRDSIPYPVEVPRDVKYIPRVYRWCFWFTMAVIGAGAVWLISRIRRKF